MPRYTPEKVQELTSDLRFPQEVLDIVEHLYLLAYDDWLRAGRLADLSEEEVQAYCLQIAWSKASEALARGGRDAYAEQAGRVASEFYGNEHHPADPHFKAALQRIHKYMQTHDYLGKPRTR